MQRGRVRVRAPSLVRFERRAVESATSEIYGQSHTPSCRAPGHALIAKEFKVRYKNTTFGFLWSLANPIFFALVFYFAFNIILKVQVEGYFPFFLAGLFPWQWFANTVNTSPGVYIGNAGLIKKVYFPRLLLPMSMAGNHSIHFLMALLVAIPILAIYGSYPTIAWIPGIP